MMETKVVIVKLGGAAITNKKGLCELGPENEVSSLLDKVAHAYQILKAAGHQLILIHGAGSFGHPQAIQYKLKLGWQEESKKEDERRYFTIINGFSHIRSCLQLLNYNMISQLESRHVPVLSLPPIHYVETKNCEESETKEFIKMASQVQRYLNLGFVPVLHGDAVLDDVRGCTILSGDIMMYQLTKLISNVCRCIFITDVYGLYPADPKQTFMNDKNDLIHSIQVDIEEAEHEMIQQDDETTYDVTGGMKGKVKWAKKIVWIRQDLDVILGRWDTVDVFDMMTLKSSKDEKRRCMTVFTRK
ncbi:Aspartate/glutamate/uridylate kinase [Cokeromyces recurvatus]|uniref:Aspartate/glutamate/uridylate kinase n=1 Tax=Cokeromyces recurvatus TaxID=90255 RepID=UPI00221E9610|nr:Aspartate/glutamate/uridylate kinase [Cokeromyces recurvatus]KAI7899808.1 Aspartate/glutamate/uridylate kinase [Cokeromyces recurvatus]